MKAKTLLLSAILLFHFFNSFSQSEKGYIYYFDKNLEITDKSNSVFTGHGVLKDGLLQLSVYSNDLPDYALLVANFTDSSLAVNQGLFQSFYLNGKKETECNYEKNQLNGPWRKWDEQSDLIDSFYYEYGKMVDSARFFYNHNKLSSYEITDLLNNNMKNTFLMIQVNWKQKCSLPEIRESGRIMILWDL